MPRSIGLVMGAWPEIKEKNIILLLILNMQRFAIGTYIVPVLIEIDLFVFQVFSKKIQQFASR
jgi:hypothetical protein